MTRRSLAFVAGLASVLVVGFEVRAAPERAPGTIRIATYNIENLFDDRDDKADHGRYDDWHDKRAGIRAKPASEQEAVAKAIREADADIIGLQEIESYDALKEFVTTYLPDMGYEHIISFDVGHERFIEQALLSRFPVTEARVWPYTELGGVHPEKYGDQPNWYAGQPILGRRSPLLATVKVPGSATGGEPYELSLLVVHHKSGRYSEYWRERETVKAVEWITELERNDPGINLVVLGDFNALPSDASVQTYFSAGMRDVFEGPDRPYTHESGRVIDLILVNEALSGEIVEGTPFVEQTPLRPLGSDWRTTPAPEGFASDHLLVGVDLEPVETDRK